MMVARLVTSVDSISSTRQNAPILTKPFSIVILLCRAIGRLQHSSSCWVQCVWENVAADIMHSGPKEDFSLSCIPMQGERLYRYSCPDRALAIARLSESIVFRWPNFCSSDGRQTRDFTICLVRRPSGAILSIEPTSRLL